jgi:hypothetical protein
MNCPNQRAMIRCTGMRVTITLRMSTPGTVMAVLLLHMRRLDG